MTVLEKQEVKTAKLNWRLEKRLKYGNTWTKRYTHKFGMEG